MAKIKTDPAVLSARAAQRQQLKRATQRTFEEQHRLAKETLSWASHRKFMNDRSAAKVYDAIVYTTSKLAGAVAASMGVSAPIHMSVNSWTSAVTDFKTIQIKVQRDRYDTNDMHQMSRLVAFLKGLVYHEVGHIKHTIPLLALRERVSPQVVGDVPVTSALHRAWNFLEDQRMECAMVRDSNILRYYFETIVLDHVTKTWNPHDVRTNPWPLVAGRTYLPKKFIKEWRTAAQEMCAGADPELVDEVAATIRRYKRASTADEMWLCVVHFNDLLARWKSVTGVDMPQHGGVNNHDDYGRGNKSDDEVRRIIEDSSSDDDESGEEEEEGAANQGGDDAEKQGDDGSGTGASDDEQDGDEVSTPSSDDSGEEQDNGVAPQEGKPSDNGDGGTDKPFDKESINDAINEAVDNVVKDQEVKDFMASVNEEMRSSMKHNVRVRPMTTEVADGEQVCRGMIGTLEALMDHTEPAWRFRQEDGILDPTAFMTRESGDTDFWVNLNDQGKNGFDLAVSVLLDVSSSMSGEETDLGIAAYGIRRACDDLGVPCTVTTFSSDTEMLWDAHEEVRPVIPTVQSSTNPLDGLMSLDDQRHGKGRHLVVILTDGVWNENINLGRWRGNGRYILAAGIGNEHLLEYLNRANPDIAVSIDGPLDLPNEVAKALIPFII